MNLEVSDRLALTDLVHRYAAGVDDRELDSVVELFTEEGQLVLPDPPGRLEPVSVHRGHDAILSALSSLDSLIRTEHMIVGEVYTPEGAAAARGRVTCVAHHWSRSDEDIVDLVWHIRYDDHYERTPSGWRITHRRLTLNAIETGTARRLR